jgi:hypothetical protein
MSRIGAIALVLVVLSIPASADDFSSVVKQVESHYGVRQLHPRLIGFALFFFKPAMWGSGVSGLKVAAFEEEKRTFTSSTTDLEKIMRTTLSPKWKPFVRVDSRRDGEAAVVYADFSGKHMHMLVASVERHEIAVVQMKISDKALKRWYEDPAAEARGVSHK